MEWKVQKEKRFILEISKRLEELSNFELLKENPSIRQKFLSNCNAKEASEEK